MVADPAGKDAVFRATGCAAVEMESAAVQRLAETAGVPFVHVRVILDAADEQLDPAMVSLIDSDGNVRIGTAIALLARRPMSISAMLRLLRRTKMALRALRPAVREVVESLSCHDTQN
jgi:adenosylhomocysteine nucleosidase